MNRDHHHGVRSVRGRTVVETAAVAVMTTVSIAVAIAGAVASATTVGGAPVVSGLTGIVVGFTLLVGLPLAAARLGEVVLEVVERCRSARHESREGGSRDESGLHEGHDRRRSDQPSVSGTVSADD